MTDSLEPPRAFLGELFTGAPPADPVAALNLAASRARARSYVVLPLGLQPVTDARELASLHAAIALQSVRHGRPLAPTLILSAGPVLRNGAAAGAADFLLALALSLDENAAIHAFACGPAPAPAPASATAEPAGSDTAFMLGPDTVRRAHALGLQPGACLLAGDARSFFAALGNGHCVVPAPDQVLRAVFISVD
jgi:hydroxypyruvate reductase